MYFGDDLIPRPITFSEFSFDLGEANHRLKNMQTDISARLQGVASRFSSPKCGKEHWHIGILVYWYSQDSIRSRKKNKFLCEVLFKIKSIILKSFAKKMLIF